MVKRVTDWLRKIRAELDTSREAQNRAIELFGNLQTLAQEEWLLYKLGHDVTLLREVLESSDPAALRDAWLGLSDEKRMEIMQAASDAESQIKADS
jgi:hypothetical protein